MMKNNFVLIVLLVCFLFMISFVGVVMATEKNITATEDSWVASSSPDSNYGSSNQMQIDYPSFFVNSIDKAWIKFSLTSLPSGSSISEAKVYLYTAGEAAGEPTIRVHFSSTDSWTETGITYNNQPSYGPTLDSVTLPVTSAHKWYSWTVTSTIQSEVSGDKIVSFCFETTTSDVMSTWASREADDMPYLKITYEDEGYTPSESPNFYDIPYKLKTMLTIPLFAAQLLTTIIFIGLFDLPMLLITRYWDVTAYATLTITFLVMGFCVAMGWLPYWFMLVFSLVVALLFAATMRGWISGRD